MSFDKKDLTRKIEIFKSGLSRDNEDMINIDDNIKSIANNFPNDITKLGYNDLMLLWGACIKMKDYALYKESIYDTDTKIKESIKKYVESLLLVYISNNSVEKLTSREQRAAWVRVQTEYMEAETDYLLAYNSFNTFKVLVEIYNNKIFLCSRELSRRGFDVEVKRSARIE